MPKYITYCVRKKNKIKLLAKKLGAPWKQLGMENMSYFILLQSRNL